MDKKKMYLGIFAFCLVLFAFFSTKVGFHDSYEYITVAKYFAGINNVDLFSTHSILYPFIIALPLKLLPFFIAIKLMNVLWIFLIGLVLFYKTNNKAAFILFATSPLTWYISIQTTPLLPASFFLLLGYIFFKEKVPSSKMLSGIFLGISCAFYTPVILIGGIFILVYFWNKKFSSLILYFLFTAIGFLPRLILDQIYMGSAFYTLMRYFGTNFLISLGMNSNISATNISNMLGIFIILVAISPLLFKAYRINFKEYKKEILFLAISSIVLIIRVTQLKYFLLISGIFFIIFGDSLTKKEIKIHVILSIIIIPLLCFGFFGQTKDVSIKNDLKTIILDYPEKQIVAGPFEANTFASLLWENKPRIYWFMDYQAYIEKKNNLKEYSFSFIPNIPIRENIVFSGTFVKPNLERTYEDVLIISQEKNLRDFEKVECYKVLCVYKNQ